jgi:hypothetical protein
LGRRLLDLVGEHERGCGNADESSPHFRAHDGEAESIETNVVGLEQVRSVADGALERSRVGSVSVNEDELATLFVRVVDPDASHYGETGM